MNISKKKHGELVRENILNCIIAYIQDKGYAPTVRELCEMTGLKSTSSVHSHLLRMNNLGMIEVEIDKPRAIRIPGYKFIKESDLCNTK